MQAVENLSTLQCMPASDIALRLAVVDKQKVPDDIRNNLGFCLKPPEVEQRTISSTSDSDSDVTLSESISQHGGEHETEQVGDKTQPCFTPLETGKGS